VSQEVEIRLEVPFFPPDGPDVVSSRMQEAIDEAVTESDVEAVTDDGKVRTTYGQQLPTVETIGLITAILKLLVVVTPIAWPHIRALIEKLRKKLRNEPVASKIRIHIFYGDTEILLDGLSDDDAFVIFIGDCELLFGPGS
jgi:hypothetical protein